MKRKNLRVREVIAAERGRARRWLRDARSHLQMAEDNLREARVYLRSVKKPTREDRVLVREAERLVRDAKERRTYFEGVVMGMAVLDNAISKRMIAAELDPFGTSRR